METMQAEAERGEDAGARPATARAGRSPQAHPRRLLPYLVLFGGVLVVSTSALLIKAANDQGVAPLVTAAGRLSIATLLLTPLALLRAGGELRRAGRRTLALGALAGIFLAVHFAAWITSLSYTSVASSTALVTTNPIFVGLASYLLFKERIARAALAGIALTIGGSLVIALSDSGQPGSDALLGDGLALAGAVCASAYFLTGREARRSLSILPYIWLAYSSAAVVLLGWALLAGYRLTGYDTTVYLILLALAVGPQLLGHTAFNWSLNYLSATFITVAILGEPLGSTALAIVLRDEWPRPLQLAGGALVLLGIAWSTLAEAVSGRRSAKGSQRTQQARIAQNE